MKNLYLIDGASGTGKSDLVHYVTDFKNDVKLVQKYTTRAERDYEKKLGWKLDLEIQSHGEFTQHDLDYTYYYGGERYGFYNKDLIEALHNYSNVFLIVRSAEIIRQIQQDFNYIRICCGYGIN